MKWTTSKFESLYAVPSRNGIYKSKEFHGSGIRIVNMGEMFAFPFIGNQEMQLLRVTDEEFEKAGLKAGDLLFARRSLVEEGAGKCSLIVPHDQPMVFESSMIRVRLRREHCNPRFYYYYFKSPVGRSSITAIVTGVAQKGIRGSDLATIEVHNPPLPTQQRIADILSNYDRLIDNNTRRIALLEESIHRLYKEWFVYLRFPGCDRVKVVDGVPEEWQKKSIENLIGFHMGGGWGKEEQEEKHSAPGFVIRGTDIPGISIGNISSVPFRYHQENNLRSRSLCDGDLIFEVSGGSKTHGVGRTLLVTENLLSKFNGSVMCASFCKVIRPIERDLTEYLWCLLLAERDSGGLTEYESQSASNIINFKFKEFLSNKLVLFPSTQILQKFNEFVRPPLEQIHNLGFQNQKLCEARDLLLPRLMNGSIPV